MMKGLGIAAAVAVGFGAIIFLHGAFTHPPTISVQRGFRGVAMQEVYNPQELRHLAAKNVVPEPELAVDKAGTPSSAVYQNVKVLGDVDANEFARLMQAVTNWVAPQQGCTYCHNQNNFADDSLYTKIVARRMFQMVRHINTDWYKHVGNTGVTCYTCHRGQPVPSVVWFKGTPTHEGGILETDVGQNRPAIGSSSLPYDPFTPFLDGDQSIRVQGPTALPTTDRQSIKQTEWTYALMFHITESLGVNCTYCHNSRSWQDWSQSTPARVTAWYGIRLARDLNVNYLESLNGVFPANRLGPVGDVPKTNCGTCHQGAYKPLFGASMLKDYPELTGTQKAAALEAEPAKP